MRSIQIAHRDAKTWSDKWALTMVRLFRWGMDTATWYTHDEAVAKGEKDPKEAKVSRWSKMTERKWLIRSIFLESVAGVPGMVAGSLRHLRSLRQMKRDNGWYVFPSLLCICMLRASELISLGRIETLLEEAFNERMHLLTFLKMAEPGWFMKVMISKSNPPIRNFSIRSFADIFFQSVLKASSTTACSFPTSFHRGLATDSWVTLKKKQS